MIRFLGEEDKPVSFVTFRRKGHPMQILTENSDPKDLFKAVYELASRLNQIHQEMNSNKKVA